MVCQGWASAETCAVQKLTRREVPLTMTPKSSGLLAGRPDAAERSFAMFCGRGMHSQ